jgi:hypothetical protein
MDFVLHAAVGRLIAAAGMANPAESTFRTASISGEMLSDVIRTLPLSTELLDWYAWCAPVEFWFWWGNQLYLHDPRQLPFYHRVYGQSGQEGKEDEDWGEGWRVIGHWGADPIIAHVDLPGTPVSTAIGGIDEWVPKRIAPDLASFLNGIAVTLEVFFYLYDNAYQDEDFNILPEVMADFQRRIRFVLAEEYARYWPLPIDYEKE